MKHIFLNNKLLMTIIFNFIFVLVYAIQKYYTAMSVAVLITAFLASFYGIERLKFGHRVLKGAFIGLILACAWLYLFFYRPLPANIPDVQWGFRDIGINALDTRSLVDSTHSRYVLIHTWMGCLVLVLFFMRPLYVTKEHLFLKLPKPLRAFLFRGWIAFIAVSVCVCVAWQGICLTYEYWKFYDWQFSHYYGEFFMLHIKGLIIPAVIIALRISPVYLWDRLMENATIREWFITGIGGSARWSGPATYRKLQK